MRIKFIHIKSLLTILLSLWCFGIIVPALSNSGESKIFSTFFLNKFYSLVCHQNPNKTFILNGNELEVCARCTGIYFGAFLFSILTFVFPVPEIKSKNLLIAGMIPMLIDVVFYSTGIYSYSKAIAFSTGLILGSVCILYIFVSLDHFISELNLSRNVQ